MTEETKGEERVECELCSKEAAFSFGVGKTARYGACEEHAKTISDIIYPIGGKFAAIILKNFNL